MKQETFLHVGFQRDGTEKCILSLNPDRDTSAAWKHIKRDIKPDHTLNIWFYGVKREHLCERIFEQTKSAMLDGTFKSWFK